MNYKIFFLIFFIMSSIHVWKHLLKNINKDTKNEIQVVDKEIIFPT